MTWAAALPVLTLGLSSGCHALLLSPRAAPAHTCPVQARSAAITMAEGDVLLNVEDLQASVQDTPILKGVNMCVKRGEVHAIMGPNGSGKSTFSKVLVGHPAYEVTGGTVNYREGEDLLDLEPQERAQQGVFLAFQYPVEIPGVSNADFLRLAVNKRRAALGESEYDPIEFFGVLGEKMSSVGMSMDFLNREVNSGFSGGEKKRNEILQMALLEPEIAILVRDRHTPRTTPCSRTLAHPTKPVSP